MTLTTSQQSTDSRYLLHLHHPRSPKTLSSCREINKSYFLELEVKFFARLRLQLLSRVYAHIASIPIEMVGGRTTLCMLFETIPINCLENVFHLIPQLLFDFLHYHLFTLTNHFNFMREKLKEKKKTTYIRCQPRRRRRQRVSSSNSSRTLTATHTFLLTTRMLSLCFFS